MVTTSTPRVPLARTTDPRTSHDAAERSERFTESHKRRILEALQASRKEMTAGEIGAACGLTVVQVDRRMDELKKAGKVETPGTKFCTLNGCSMNAWRLPK